jgi:prolyl-tRNA synthetase
MFIKAKKEYDSHVVKLTDWDDVIPTLDRKNVILVPWCEDSECEDIFKERSSKQESADADSPGERADERAPSMGAKSLCIPFEQPSEGVTDLKCIQCGKDAKVWGLFGRSY